MRLERLRFFLKVQDGCNKFCAYCIVPYLRGRSRSIPVVEIIEKIRKLEKEGVKEVILCGINLADYKYKCKNQKSKCKVTKKNSKFFNLENLLKKILKETKISRIRLGSINLEVFDDEFISLWSNSRLCPHFHIPLQSGCNRTLNRMGRKYNFEEFKKKIDRLRYVQQFVNITTDVLVGFPGETEREFKESLRNLKTLIGIIGKIHVFRYSKREGTKAVKMKNQVPEKVKRKRAQSVRKLSKKMEMEFSNQFIGKKLSVLFEKEKDGWFEGLSENYIRVRAEGKDLREKIKVVRIEVYKEGVLYGRA